MVRRQGEQVGQTGGRGRPLAKDRATTGQKEPDNRVNLKAGQPVLAGQILEPGNRANVGGPSGPPNPPAFPGGFAPRTPRPQFL